MFKGPASTLMAVLALLAAGARADKAATAECRTVHWPRFTPDRLRSYPTDSNATVLLMDGCSLTKIDPDALTGLPNLEEVDLSNNNIENINPAAFHSVPALTTLWLSSNKLRELPVFDERSCASLIRLILSYNKLKVIDNAGTFSACTKLQWLALGSNGIEFIHPKLFSALTDLSTLNLENNKIRFVPEQLFVRNAKLAYLTLSNNRITHLPPNFASSRERDGVALWTFLFYDNPWHCACLLELLADVKRAGDIETTHGPWKIHYIGIMPECNFIGMYPCRRDALSGLP